MKGLTADQQRQVGIAVRAVIGDEMPTMILGIRNPRTGHLSGCDVITNMPQEVAQRFLEWASLPDARHTEPVCISAKHDA